MDRRSGSALWPAAKAMFIRGGAAAFGFGAILVNQSASAQTLALTAESAAAVEQTAVRAENLTAPTAKIDTATRLRRQVIDYPTAERPGTIIVDTSNTYLYFVLGGGKAIRYSIAVGRDGFTWSGTRSIERMAEWPDWLPPAEMLQRQPYLPRFMAGGPGNPLGARAMYLSGTVYRIHGTNNPLSIGKHVSSGCIRMLNEDAIDLYARVQVGTRVVVLPMVASRAARAARAITFDRTAANPLPH